MCSRGAEKERDPTSKATRSGHMHIHGGGGTNIIVVKVEGENFVH